MVLSYFLLPHLASYLIVLKVHSKISDHYLSALSEFGVKALGEVDFARFQEVLPDIATHLNILQKMILSIGKPYFYNSLFYG